MVLVVGCQKLRDIINLNNRRTISNTYMEDFKNNTINTFELPRFEEVDLSPLDSSYLTIIWINIATLFGLIAIGAGFGFYFIDEVQPYWLPVATGYSIILLLTIVVQVISFKNKGFAFRTHDVIYRSGAIATTTTIIPYNRVQHVAMHEGFISRKLGLAAVEIFTAGGTGSDIKVPGIQKEHAEAIKQLLIGKIQNQQVNEE
jgi:membrane protein YdbS with pleckstrin-like domain